ncbi:MAG: hypothetical protein HYZ07_01935, partial [Candidatus Harrisonbacteria bacterium]|nr:hypothetical protein [Candidatus Harrisonbacteria bacterium]
MNYLRSTIIGLIAVAVLYFGGVFRREPVQTGSVPQAEELASVAKSGWETKADEQPLVAVKVTPTTFDKDAK